MVWCRAPQRQFGNKRRFRQKTSLQMTMQSGHHLDHTLGGSLLSPSQDQISIHDHATCLDLWAHLQLAIKAGIRDQSQDPLHQQRHSWQSPA